MESLENYPGYGRGFSILPQSRGYQSAYPQPYLTPTPLPQTIPSPLSQIHTNLPYDYRPPSNTDRHPPNLKAGDSNFGKPLQYFINLNSSKSKPQDGERDLSFEKPTSTLLSEAVRKKAPIRTFTVDQIERGVRSPLLDILQTRYISTLEEDGQETVVLTVKDNNAQKEGPDLTGDVRWM